MIYKWQIRGTDTNTDLQMQMTAVLPDKTVSKVTWHFTSHMLSVFVNSGWKQRSKAVSKESTQITGDSNIFPLKNAEKLIYKWWYTSCKLEAQIQITQAQIQKKIYRYKSLCIYLCFTSYVTWHLFVNTFETFEYF